MTVEIIHTLGSCQSTGLRSNGALSYAMAIVATLGVNLSACYFNETKLTYSAKIARKTTRSTRIVSFRMSIDNI
jgi:hypothetical protein